MASGPITAWQIEGENVEVVTDFLFLGSKITVDSDCSHEIRRQLLLGRKAMTNLDSVLKSRDITLLTKVHIVKAMAFPMVTYSCESRTIKKAEHQRIDTFKLWCWRRLLKVPWTARRSNQSILRYINPDYSLEGLTDFLFLGSQITADGDCHHEVRRQLLLGRKAMTNLNSVKSRDIILIKILYSRGYDLPSGHIQL